MLRSLIHIPVWALGKDLPAEDLQHRSLDLVKVHLSFGGTPRPLVAQRIPSISFLDLGRGTKYKEQSLGGGIGGLESGRKRRDTMSRETKRTARVLTSPPSLHHCYLRQLACPKSCPCSSLETSVGRDRGHGWEELCRGRREEREKDRGNIIASQRTLSLHLRQLWLGRSPLPEVQSLSKPD